MNLFIIDTSSKYLYAAFVKNGKPYYIYEDELEMKHSETLLCKIDALLREKGLALCDVDVFCAAVGPGSFTGIRIGVTTVRAFAQVFGKPVMSVNSLELLAYNIGKKGIAVPLITAVGGKYYCAAYLGNRELMPAKVLEKEGLSDLKNELAKKYSEEVFFVSNEETDGIEGIIKPKSHFMIADYCIDKALRGEYTDYSGLVPDYAALSQAEKEYENRNKRME